MRGFYRKFLNLVLLFSIITVFLIFIFWWGIFGAKIKNSEKIVFSVKKGENFLTIGRNLEKEGLIKNRIFFYIYVLLKKEQKNFKAGRYLLSSSMNIPQIVEKLTSGYTEKVKITIPEGSTLKDIEEKLKIKLKGENLEGYLFPDTYYFPLGFTSEEVIKIMRENFEKKIALYKNEIEKSGKTLHEIIIMASILEKEAKSKEDKEIISGILWKRLKAGIPLQVDSTLTYITGKKSKELTADDLEIPSPYNTYKYKGLPPTPICNPGLESILAALRPKESEYWYYFSTSEGRVIFSKTLLEHNLAKEKYLW
jgi:UPF0755 protein